MVTKYSIPCSSCGKIVERYVFCSGACKVKGHRERQTGKEIAKTIEPFFPKVALNLMEKNNIRKAVEHLEQFSDIKKEGYHYSQMLGKYVKD